MTRGDPRRPFVRRRASAVAIAGALASMTALTGPHRPLRGQPVTPAPIALHLDYTLDRTEDPESFTLLGGLAAAVDGGLFAVDSVDHRILRFGPGPGHAFERAWGGWGSAQGQFDFTNYGSVFDGIGASIGLAVGADGTLWVADTGNHRVQHFSADGTFRGGWGRLGGAPGEFKWPVAIAAAADGTLYVSDAGNRRVQHLGADGRPLQAWGIGDIDAPEAGRPAGIAVGADGTIVVADVGPEPRLRRYGPTGVPLPPWRLVGTSIGASEPSDQRPLGVAAAPDATFYVSTAQTMAQPFAHLAADGRVLEWLGASSPGWIGGAIGGIAVGVDGTVFGASRDAIVLIGPNGADRRAIAARPLGYGRIGPDTALAVDALGREYAVDPLSRRVQVFTADGSLLQEWRGSTSATGGSATSTTDDRPFIEPRDVAVAPDGTIFVVDTAANRVRWRSADGEREGGWGAAGADDGLFDAPRGIAVAPDGIVYVADTGNDRVQAFGSDGTFVGTIGTPTDRAAGEAALGQLDEPVDVAIAPDGSLHVVEAGGHRVQIFDRDGTARFTLGTYGPTDGQLQDPAAIAVDPDGGTWVADRVNSRLVRWDSCGRTLEGWGGSISSRGAFHVGEVSAPTGIAFAADGTAFVADSGNERIQRIAPDGRVDGVWGMIADAGPSIELRALVKTEGDLASSTRLAAAPDGTFVALDDWVTPRVQRFSPDGVRLGQFALFARADEGIVRNGRDVAVTPDGSVVVLGGDDDGACVTRFDASGRWLNRWARDDGGGCDRVAAAPDGTLYIADATSGTVSQFHPDGTPFTTFGDWLRGPFALAIGPTGDVYTAQESSILRHSRDGHFETAWGGPGSGTGLFDRISDLAAWPDGTVVAGDWGNQRVQLFDPDGRFLGQWGVTVNHDVPPWPFPGPLTALADGSLIVRGTNGRLQRFLRTASATWHVAYYPNRWLAQRPLAIERTATPSFAWGAGSPHVNIPRDGFSVLIQRVVELPAGRHRYRIRATGGVRAWVDDRLVVDDWDGPTVDASFDVDSTAAPIAIRVAYDDPGGDAGVRVEGP